MLRATLVARRACTREDFRVYLVTDDKFYDDTLLERIHGCIEGGATCVQVRLKHQSKEALLDLTRSVVALARPHGVKVIVDDRADVCVEAGADGVHIGRGDLAPDVARGIIGPDRILGVTVYGSAALLRDAVAAGADYVGTGAVFGSSTKESAAQNGLESLASLRRCPEAARLPVVAIGGITPRNAASCVAHGADGVAMVSGLLRADADADADAPPDATPRDLSRRLAEATLRRVRDAIAAA